ncbi:MAG: hypothetical protein JNL39_02065 [Opitutaceae bacterium]|nr:hypothetical protein [Opitutaceae bacterium]
MILGVPEYFAGFEAKAMLIALLAALPYFGFRALSGLIARKSWREIIADGSKPITGRIWLDVLVFVSLLIAVAAIFAFAMRN